MHLFLLISLKDRQAENKQTIKVNTISSFSYDKLY